MVSRDFFFFAVLIMVQVESRIVNPHFVPEKIAELPSQEHPIIQEENGLIRWWLSSSYKIMLSTWELQKRFPEQKNRYIAMLDHESFTDIWQVVILPGKGVYHIAINAAITSSQREGGLSIKFDDEQVCHILIRTERRGDHSCMGKFTRISGKFSIVYQEGKKKAQRRSLSSLPKYPIVMLSNIRMKIKLPSFIRKSLSKEQ